VKIGPDDDRDREEDEKRVRYDICSTHRDELRVALPTLRSWIRNNLPIMCDWLALGECSDEDCEEGGDEEDLNRTKGNFIARLPHAGRQTLEELGYGKLGSPDAVVRLAYSQLVKLTVRSYKIA
jgi:hypothetical protein